MEKPKAKRASRKPEVNFNEFWPDLKAEASKQGLGVVEWMEKSFPNQSTPYRRHSEFNNGTRDISAYYFINLLGGLSLMPQDFEKRTGKKFSEDQKKAINRDSKIRANLDLFGQIVDDPDFLNHIKKLAKHWKKS